RESLRLISRGRGRRRTREVEKHEKKAGDDHAAREKERTDLPARAAEPGGLARRRPTVRDGLPVGTVLHAPRLRRAHGLREAQGRRSAARRAALRARGLRAARAGGSMPRGLRVLTPATKRPRSSAASNGALTRRRTIAPATRAASGSSPYSAKTRRRSFSAQLFTMSAALMRPSGSARMSSGPRE